MTGRHAPGEARRTPYPGGKNNWFRVGCVAEGCDYNAWEAHEHRAMRRVQSHADAKNENEEAQR